MNWIKKRILRWVREDWRDAGSRPVAVDDCQPDDRLDMEKALRFNVLPCQGGVVIECRTFDRKTHMNDTRTFIIPEGEPIAERIGQIVSMEILRS